MGGYFDTSIGKSVSTHKIKINSSNSNFYKNNFENSVDKCVDMWNGNMVVGNCISDSDIYRLFDEDNDFNRFDGVVSFFSPKSKKALAGFNTEKGKIKCISTCKNNENYILTLSTSNLLSIYDIRNYFSPVKTINLN